MVSPEHFDVRYAINPHMIEPSGKLKQVQRELAQLQWNQLKAVYEELGLAVHVIPGEPDFPDMVFCANQTFPFLDRFGKPCVLLSRMHAPERKGEVPIFRTWFESRGYQIHESEGDLEGSGDLLWDFEGNRVFAGYGFRTSAASLDWAEMCVGRKFLKLELRDPRFYHLDTCLAILNSHCAAYVPAAFTPEGVRALQDGFPDLIPIEEEEAAMGFAANCHSPDGRAVILPMGGDCTKQELERRGFRVIEVDTSEFIKAGGSVFCLKQMFFKG